jgi:hypothetical protein
MKKRLFVQAALSLGAAALLAPAATAQTRPQLEVWKDPNCGCCKDWVAHMQASGFAVKVHDSGNSAARKRLGMPDKLGSCHTALVGGYAIEGHVPAREVQRLLKERPAALGLAVPGMPVGSPGMDGAIYGERKDPYDVLLVSRSGGTRVYQSYRS